MTTVLVADDDNDNRALMTAVLTSMGIVVIAATTGQDALTAAHRHQVNAILLDVRMPGLSGLEVCESLRAAGYGDIPILLISACAARSEIEAGLNSGADDYLVKPFRIAEFARRVSRLLAMPRPAVSPAMSAALATRSAHAGRSVRHSEPALALG